ncbi:MAG: endonuclease domain-containing protein [Deltaproteobacteria bacterium]|nr:endonuclease domain-containing protein [Deltaproteobacteria bacterium]
MRKRTVPTEDRRKDEVLRGLGFKVLRFTNKEVLKDPEGCAAKALSLT